MKKVFNVPRIAAKDFGNDDPKLKDKLAWISISEPEEQNTIVSNKYLDKCPTLKLAFYDLKDFCEYKGKIIGPPRKRDASKLVNFLVANQDKSVIVNCAAGVSRSGAVCQFCQDFLGYSWPDFYKGMAIPNSVLYKLMVECFTEQFVMEDGIAKRKEPKKMTILEDFLNNPVPYNKTAIVQFMNRHVKNLSWCTGGKPILFGTEDVDESKDLNALNAFIEANPPSKEIVEKVLEKMMPGGPHSRLLFWAEKHYNIV